MDPEKALEVFSPIKSDEELGGMSNGGVNEKQFTTNPEIDPQKHQGKSTTVGGEDSTSVVSEMSGESLSHPGRPKWGSSVRNLQKHSSLRQWATSFSSLSTSRTEEGEWCCQLCSYENADASSRICALCGGPRPERPLLKKKHASSSMLSTVSGGSGMLSYRSTLSKEASSEVQSSRSRLSKEPSSTIQESCPSPSREPANTDTASATSSSRSLNAENNLPPVVPGTSGENKNNPSQSSWFTMLPAPVSNSKVVSSADTIGSSSTVGASNLGRIPEVPNENAHQVANENTNQSSTLSVSDKNNPQDIEYTPRDNMVAASTVPVVPLTLPVSPAMDSSNGGASSPEVVVPPSQDRSSIGASSDGSSKSGRFSSSVVLMPTAHGSDTIEVSSVNGSPTSNIYVAETGSNVGSSINGFPPYRNGDSHAHLSGATNPTVPEGENDSSFNMWWNGPVGNDTVLATTSETAQERGGLGSKPYFKCCSNRRALLALILLLLVGGGVALAVILAQGSSSSGSSSNSESNSEGPIDGMTPAPTTTDPVMPPATPPPSEPFSPPTSPPPTLVPTPATTPLPSPLPTTARPTMSPTAMPTTKEPTPEPTIPPRQFRLEQIGDTIGENGLGGSFGWPVTLSKDGGVVAIAAPNARTRETTGNDRVGVVQVYKKVDGVWQQLGQNLPGREGGERFGQAISLSSDGTTLAVGGPKNDFAGTRNAGRVVVYNYSELNNRWNQLGFEIREEGDDRLFGRTVSLSGDGSFVAVGSRFGAYVYQVDRFGSVRLFDLRKDERFPLWTVSLSDDGATLALGAPPVVRFVAPAFVAVYHYNFETTELRQLGQTLEQRGDVKYAPFVCLSKNGDFLAVGASTLAEDPVRVFRYNRQEDLWDDMPTPPVPSHSFVEVLDNDYFSSPEDFQSVSLSDDGKVLVANHPDWDIPFVFRFDNATQTWESVLDYDEVEFPGEENFEGRSVSMSGNGNLIAVGNTDTDEVNLFHLF